MASHAGRLRRGGAFSSQVVFVPAGKVLHAHTLGSTGWTKSDPRAIVGRCRGFGAESSLGGLNREWMTARSTIVKWHCRESIRQLICGDVGSEGRTSRSVLWPEGIGGESPEAAVGGVRPAGLAPGSCQVDRSAGACCPEKFALRRGQAWPVTVACKCLGGAVLRQTDRCSSTARAVGVLGRARFLP